MPDVPPTIANVFPLTPRSKASLLFYAIFSWRTAARVGRGTTPRCDAATTGRLRRPSRRPLRRAMPVDRTVAYRSEKGRSEGRRVGDEGERLGGYWWWWI